MSDTELALQAVLLDLDDTLLRSDMDGVFLKHYFGMLAEYARPLVTPQVFRAALSAASKAMHDNSGPDRLTNEQAFAAAFAPRIGRPWPELLAAAH